MKSLRVMIISSLLLIAVNVGDHGDDGVELVRS